MMIIVSLSAPLKTIDCVWLMRQLFLCKTYSFLWRNERCNLCFWRMNSGLMIIHWTFGSIVHKALFQKAKAGCFRVLSLNLFNQAITYSDWTVTGTNISSLCSNSVLSCSLQSVGRGTKQTTTCKVCVLRCKQLISSVLAISTLLIYKEVKLMSLLTGIACANLRISCYTTVLVYKEISLSKMYSVNSFYSIYCQTTALL